MNYKVDGLNELSRQLNEFQINAGFIDSNKTQRLMLCASEIFEAFEAFRKEKYAFDKFKEGRSLGDKFNLLNYDKKECSNDTWKCVFEEHIKDTFEDEITDAIIRLVALCGENGIDIEKHIKMKMQYNELRGYKYGGKKF